MSDTSPLFKAAQMGATELNNRVLMAALTRNRAGSDVTPKDIAREYYAQRASAGLIFTEATQISACSRRDLACGQNWCSIVTAWPGQ